MSKLFFLLYTKKLFWYNLEKNFAISPKKRLNYKKKDTTNMNILNKSTIYSFIALLLLNGCSTTPQEFNIDDLPSKVAQIKEDGGYYKVGNTYTIMGQTHTPNEDYSYTQ